MLPGINKTHDRTRAAILSGGGTAGLSSHPRIPATAHIPVCHLQDPPVADGTAELKEIAEEM